MKKLLALLLLLLLPTTAVAQLAAGYVQVGDTSPATLVWEAGSGSFVSNTSAGYQNYLANLAALPTNTRAIKVCGANNNGGAVQLVVCSSNLLGGWATGQIKTVFGVGGVPGANGSFTITLDSVTNGLVTLQGSTFSGVWTGGGTIGAAPLIDTARAVYQQIDEYNRFQFYSGQQYFIPAFITNTVTLTNPLAPAYFVEMGGAGLTITLPQANLLGSIPIGQPILFYNPGFPGFTVKDFGGNTLKNLTNVQSIQLMLLDNGTTQGSWAFIIGSN
jgi:hypothetical protein